LKPEVRRIDLKNSIPTSQETLRLRYKAQPVNAVQGNNRCLLRELYKTRKYNVRAKLRLFCFKAGGTYSYHCAVTEL
jgi:hypothetical protein